MYDVGTRAVAEDFKEEAECNNTAPEAEGGRKGGGPVVRMTKPVVRITKPVVRITKPVVRMTDCHRGVLNQSLRKI